MASIVGDIQASAVAVDVRPQAEGLRGDISALFMSTVKVPTRANLREFIKSASLMSLDVAELERFLSSLEQARIISTPQKCKILFLQACRQNQRERALGYLEAIESKQSLAIELLSDPTTPSLALELLTKDGLVFSKSEVSIPSLLRLLEAGVDLQKVFVGLKSATLWAFQTKNRALIEALIPKQSTFSYTLLDESTVHEFFIHRLGIENAASAVYVLDEMQKMGASSLAVDSILFSYAASRDDVPLLKTLLERGLQVSQWVNGKPLLSSLIADHPSIPLKCCELLLSKDATCDLQDSEENTALHHAIIKGSDELTRLLLHEHWANPFLFNKEGQSPFKMLATHDSSEMRAIITHPSICQRLVDLSLVSPVLKSLSSPCSREVSSFLESYVTHLELFTFYTQEGLSFFSEMCRLKANSAVRNLLQKGYDLTTQQECGKSPFSQLIEDKNTNGITYLIEGSLIDQNSNIPNGSPLVFWLVENERLDLLQALIKKGQSANVTNQSGQTLLHVAVICSTDEKIDIVKYLLDLKKIDSNALDHAGLSALHYALRPYKKNIVQMLLQAGARSFFTHEDDLRGYLSHLQNHDLETLIGFSSLWQKCARKDFFAFYVEFKKRLINHSNLEEALEICFLLPNILDVPGALFEKKESYIQALLKLHKKYPQAPDDYFTRFLAPIATQHLRRPFVSTTVPQVLEQVEVLNLLSAFDKIQWDEERICIKGQEFQIADLRQALHTLLTQHVLVKEPSDGFYNQLEKLLKHLTIELQSSKDPALVKESLLTLAHSTLVRPEELIDVCYWMYKRLKFKLSDLQILEEAIENERHAHRQNIHSRARKIVQNEIPNPHKTPEAKQAYDNLVRYYFFIEYSALSILNETYKSFQAFNTHRFSLVLEWFRAHMPPRFCTQSSDDCLWAVKSLDLFSHDPEFKKKAITQIYAKKGFSLPSEVSADEAHRLFCEHEYLNKYVLESDKKSITGEAVFYFLKQREYLTEPFESLFSNFYFELNKKGA